VSRKRPKRLIGRNQNGEWGGCLMVAAGSNTQSPHRERASNLTGACLRNSQLGKPDEPHPRQGSGILTARKGEGTAGRGCRKKRRPSCNRADRATEGWRYPTRKGLP